MHTPCTKTARNLSLTGSQVEGKKAITGHHYKAGPGPQMASSSKDSHLHRRQPGAEDHGSLARSALGGPPQALSRLGAMQRHSARLWLGRTPRPSRKPGAHSGILCSWHTRFPVAIAAEGKRTRSSPHAHC